VDGDKLICFPGGEQGAVAALDKKTGSVLWRSKDYTEQASYASPLAIEVGGIRHYVVLTNAGLAGIAAKDGELLWKYAKSYREFVIPTPIFHAGKVYVSVGYGAGSDLVELTAEDGKLTAKKMWANKIMKNNLGGVVLVDGHFYGYSDKRGWLCQNAEDGKVVWENKDELGPGSLTCADGHLYALTQDEGTVALIEATPTEWKLKGRFDLPTPSKLRKPDGRFWTYPVVANGRLYLRDQDLLFCFDVRGANR
jgi:outer membrane protein assembly factor BamB